MKECSMCKQPMIVRLKIEKKAGVWENHYYCNNRSCVKFDEEQLVETEGEEEKPKKK